MKMHHVTLVGFLFVAVACNTSAPKAEPEMKVEEKKALTVQLVSDKDPVCGMTVGTEPADTTLHNGNVYGFCSEECKQGFLKDSATVVNHQ